MSAVPECSVIIPARDEGAAITSVLQRVRAAVPEAELLLVDNGSVDETALRAAAAGARVVREMMPGKGAAMRQGAREASGRLFVFLDGDGTYPPESIPRLLESLRRGEGDIVVGSRFLWQGAPMTRMRRWGNRILSLLASWVYTDTSDLCSGFYAMSRSVWDQLNLQCQGFEIEAELLLNASRLGLRRHEIPIVYAARTGVSKLRPWRDGCRYLYRLMAGPVRSTRAELNAPSFPPSTR